MPTRTEL